MLSKSAAHSSDGQLSLSNSRSREKTGGGDWKGNKGGDFGGGWCKRAFCYRMKKQKNEKKKVKCMNVCEERWGHGGVQRETGRIGWSVRTEGGPL